MKKENTRDKIVKTARKLFQEKGYEGVRMQEIADKAQINKGLLHYYFKSKDNIFQEVFESASKTLVGKLKHSMEQDLPLFDKIDLVIDNYIEVLSKNRFLPIFIFQEINRNPEYLLSKFNEFKTYNFLSSFISQVKKEQEAGKISAIDPFNLLLNILGMTIFPFIAGNLIVKIFNIAEQDYLKMLNDRKILISEFTKNALTNKGK